MPFIGEMALYYWGHTYLLLLPTACILVPVNATTSQLDKRCEQHVAYHE